MKRGSDILAFTVAYGSRLFFEKNLPHWRATAGQWFDHALFLGGPSEEAKEAAERLLYHPEGYGCQHLTIWPENRGQHHATAAALKLAREGGYTWLLRLDDDITAKTKKWLAKLLTQLRSLRRLTGDQHNRIIAGPKISGLRNPPPAEGVIQKGQRFPVEIVSLLGGACRLHPVDLLADYEPPLYAPMGRGDPQSLAAYLHTRTVGGTFMRFPAIRMQHPTNTLESRDTPEESLQRRMSWYWPFLGPLDQEKDEPNDESSDEPNGS